MRTFQAETQAMNGPFGEDFQKSEVKESGLVGTNNPRVFSTLTTEDLNSSPRVGEGNGNPLQYSCLGIPWTQEPGGLGTAKSQTH